MLLSDCDENTHSNQIKLLGRQSCMYVDESQRRLVKKSSTASKDYYLFKFDLVLKQNPKNGFAHLNCIKIGVAEKTVNFFFQSVV